MRRILFFIVYVPIIIVATAVLVANRDLVPVRLDPFSPDDPALVIDIPLFVLILIVLFCGMLMGAMATWMGQGRWRKAARVNRDEAVRWQAEAKRLKTRTEPENPGLPLIGVGGSSKS